MPVGESNPRLDVQSVPCCHYTTGQKMAAHLGIEPSLTVSETVVRTGTLMSSKRWGSGSYSALLFPVAFWRHGFVGHLVLMLRCVARNQQRSISP